MASTVLRGTITPNGSFTYTNNTGGNVRFIIYYLYCGTQGSNGVSGVFGFGGAGNDRVEWDVYEGTTIGKSVAHSFNESGEHGYVNNNIHPVEIMLANSDTVTWVPTANTTWARNPSYNFLVIPENNLS